MAQSNKKYIINGVEYNSLDEVPKEHRSSIEAFEKIANASDRGIFKALGSLISFGFNSRKSNNNTKENPEKTDIQKEGGFLQSKQFKIMMACVAIVLIAYIILFNNSKGSKQIETTELHETNAKVNSGNHQRYSLLIDDPNEPPYIVFVGLYDEDKLLFRMDLPSGELQETNQKNLIELQERLEEETDLIRKNITLSWIDEWNVDDSYYQLTISNKTFYSNSKVDYSTDSHTRLQQYAYPYKNGCFMITLTYYFKNTEETTNTNKFNVRADLANFEQILSTLEETQKDQKL